MIETDRWPMVKARWFTDVPKDAPRHVRVIVIHDMEYPEKGTAAEDVARYFQNPLDKQGKPVRASAHVCIDNNSIVQCVPDSDVAYAAPGCNNDGIQIELAGYGRQSRGLWLDAYGRAMLDLAANVVAQYCLKFDIPPRHLTNDQLSAGERGIVGHDQVSAVYRRSKHTDPGPNFPWEWFMGFVDDYHSARAPRG